MAVLHQIRTKVVGVTKKNECDERIQELLDSISDYAYDGMPLELEHEPNNEYDPNAIKVYCDGDHIGYLSREMAETIVDAVDEGRVEAEIAEITGGDEKSYGCNIVIRILDTQAASVVYTSRPKTEPPADLVASAREYVKTTPTVNVAAIQNQFHVGYSTAAAIIDKLEELGDVGPFEGSKPRMVFTYEPPAVRTAAPQPAQKPLAQRIFKPVLITCLIVIVISWGAVFAITRHREKERNWDRLAISTAMVALDQFAPGVEYGPAKSTGWLVTHNPDGTTTVWAPRDYGRISLMMTDDGEAYTPYWISVNGTVVLDVGKP